MTVTVLHAKQLWVLPNLAGMRDLKVRISAERAVKVLV